MKLPPNYRHRFPAEIISHAVWLYHVFSLRLRDVELILAERGVAISYETIRRWCRKFGGGFANCLHRRRPHSGDKWYLDEVFIRIQGVQDYIWRAVDQQGVALDILVEERRDAKAAKRFFKRLLRGLQYEPRGIITDRFCQISRPTSGLEVGFAGSPVHAACRIPSATAVRRM
jgi:putative transposase